VPNGRWRRDRGVAKDCRCETERGEEERREVFGNHGSLKGRLKLFASGRCAVQWEMVQHVQ